MSILMGQMFVDMKFARATHIIKPSPKNRKTKKKIRIIDFYSYLNI